MVVTREQVEGQITAKMQQLGIERPEAIEELLAGAEKGAAKAEKAVTLAQDALTREKNEGEQNRLKGIIASEGRFASLERDLIAFLKEIAKEDAKKQQ
jgi:hypothetical protein